MTEKLVTKICGDHTSRMSGNISVLLLGRLNVENSMRLINGHEGAHGAAEKKAAARKLSDPCLCVSCVFSWLSSQNSAAASIDGSVSYLEELDAGLFSGKK